MQERDGNAIVYCANAFGTTNGKTAHGLCRKTRRYDVVAVVDPRHAGRDAGEVLDGRPNGIPVVADIAAALAASIQSGKPATHCVIGLTPDGGRLPPESRTDVLEAIRAGLNVDSGLHDFLSDDPEFVAAAKERGVTLRDIRRSPPRDQLHGFSGKIEEVDSFRVAVLGTDSAVGKRTTATILTDALTDAGIPSLMVGTGQTAWLQGNPYCLLLDAMINDFVAGEIEHAVWLAWHERHPRVIVLEGQGSLMNPAYPGGHELLAAGRPEVIVLQHAPMRQEYDGFPGYPLHPLGVQIQALELISGKPVVAITLNHEGIPPAELPQVAADIEAETGLPTLDVLVDGADPLVEVLRSRLDARAASDE